jgi:hypothetical protein
MILVFSDHELVAGGKSSMYTCIRAASKICNIPHYYRCEFILQPIYVSSNEIIMKWQEHKNGLSKPVMSPVHLLPWKAKTRKKDSCMIRHAPSRDLCSWFTGHLNFLPNPVRMLGCGKLQWMSESLSVNNNPVQGPGWRSPHSESLRAGRSGIRNPVEAKDFLFSTPVPTSPGAHTASGLIATEGFSRG